MKGSDVFHFKAVALGDKLCSPYLVFSLSQDWPCPSTGGSINLDAGVKTLGSRMIH